jgi:hypothetical protein
VVVSGDGVVSVVDDAAAVEAGAEVTDSVVAEVTVDSRLVGTVGVVAEVGSWDDAVVISARVVSMSLLVVAAADA